MDIIYHNIINKIISNNNLDITINTDDVKNEGSVIKFGVKSGILASLYKIKLESIRNAVIDTFYLGTVNIIKSELIKNYNDLIFYISNEYLKVDNIHIQYNISNESIILCITLNKIIYNTYLDIIPYETRVIILSKMNPLGKSVFNPILMENKEYINNGNTLKVITGKDIKIYDLNKDSILEHPYVKAIFGEIKYYNKLNAIPNIPLNTPKIKLTKFIEIYKEDHPCKYIYCKINPKTFDIYMGHGKISRGNLNDDPWHGLDCIDIRGNVMSDPEDKIKKIKVLEMRLAKLKK
jgi:hypothetical protein